MEQVRRATPAARKGGRDLVFCAACRVSVSRDEIESRDVRLTRHGRVLCAECALATPAERAKRREAIENEFADDAPVLVPFKRNEDAASTADDPPPLPTRSIGQEILDRRVGELERAVFRLNQRIAELEARLAGEPPNAT